MRGLRSLAWFFAFAVLPVVWPSRALAIPVFARKYGFECTMCHVQFPKLNDFGQAYRDNAYRLMGKEAEEKDVFETPTPLALRTSVGYNNDTFKNPGGAEEDIRQFQVNGLDILSGGLFSDRTGYFMIYVPEIKGSRGVVAQDGTTEMANVVSALRDAPLPVTLRVGRFEPAYVAFSVKRTLTVAPYEIYEFTGPEEFALSDTQTGFEIAAVLRSQVKLAGGWVNGSGAQTDSDSPRDFYLRASKTFGRGEGQVCGHRLGGFAYFGKARLPDSAGGRSSFRRLGADLSLNFGQTNFMFLMLKGNDDAALNAFDSARDYDFSGGSVEVNHSLPHDVLGFVRWGRVNTPSEQNQDRNDWSIGLRYYAARNQAVHFEYYRRKIERGAADGMSDFEERMWTARADFAF
jgi:hypothetical protein